MNTIAILLIGVLAASEPAVKGKVLLLKTNGVMEGDVEHIGDQYRVRYATGEAWVPGDGVWHLCDSMEEAYAFLQTQTNLNDADERFRLAQWCRAHQLRRQAIEEVEAAAKLRPESAELKRLLRSLQQSDENTGPALPAAPRPEPPTLPLVDVSAEATTQFVKQIEPILMNACARCHAAVSNGGEFYLHHTYGLNSGNRKIMQQNLAATIGQINFREPMLSPLLIKAVSTHSDRMGQAPLKNHQAPAFAALRDWVKLTIATNPQLVPRTPEPSGSSGFAESKAPTPSTPGTEETPSWLPPHPAPTAPNVGPPRVPATSSSAPPAPITAPQATTAPDEPPDEFDPGPFNRQSHPTQPPTKP
jgi:hypothetical protein